MKTNQQKKQLASRGFSLIEVTIAMAIAALAIVTLLGMIPQGMTTLQEAGDQSIMGRIHQRILSEIQLTPFGTSGDNDNLIMSFDNKERFYDDQGEELLPNPQIPERATIGQIRDLRAHLYSARIHVSKTGGSPKPPSMGSGNFGITKLGTAVADPNVKTVIVEIAAVGGKDSQSHPFQWNDRKNFHLIKTYQTLIVKTGLDYAN